jgi:hypothetical protein
MKKIIVVMLLFLGTNIYPQTNYEGNRYHYWIDAPGEYFFEFKDGIFTLYVYTYSMTDAVPLPGRESDFGDINAKVITGEYSKKIVNGFEYINVNDTEFLILYDNDKYCVLYENNSEKRAYYGVNEKYIPATLRSRKPDLSSFWWTSLKFDSSLPGGTRNGISYQPPFGVLRYSSVWAYSGVNNWISGNVSIGINRIYFINGMLYPTDMNFFYYNNRAKTIRVSYNNIQEVFVLRDTVHPQIITLKESLNSEQELKIEIIDVYSGTRYNDTVISFIGFIRVNLE